MTDDPSPGFCVLYRWRLHPGRRDTFERCWRQLTEAIRRERGGLGSRLHACEDGSLVAYAQWPDEDRWRAAQQAPSADPEASALMASCIASADPPTPLRLLADAFSPPSPDDIGPA